MANLEDSPSKDPMLKRLTDAYNALHSVIDNGRFGQCSFVLDKVQIEGILGLMSGEFEGVW